MNRYRVYVTTILLSFVTILFVFEVCSSGSQLYKVTDDFMYKNNDIEYPSNIFSPNDEININIKFIQLQKGNYSFQTEWYNPLGKIQESSSYRFVLKKKSNYPLWSKLKLHKVSNQKRMVKFSYTRDYHIKLFGKWKVVLYLNGEKVTEKIFEVR